MPEQRLTKELKELKLKYDVLISFQSHEQNKDQILTGLVMEPRTMELDPKEG